MPGVQQGALDIFQNNGFLAYRDMRVCAVLLECFDKFCG